MAFLPELSPRHSFDPMLVHDLAVGSTGVTAPVDFKWLRWETQTGEQSRGTAQALGEGRLWGARDSWVESSGSLGVGPVKWGWG